MSNALRTLTSAAKDRLPDSAVTAAKGAALRWGEATASARMLPSIIVAGAQRCGTTTLYRVLAEHPDVVRPTFSKGIGYFDDHHDRGMRWYQAHFPLERVARAMHRGRGTPVAFEGGGYYCFHPLAPQRIADELPDARVVMLIRDPANRAFSAHKHETARGFETEPFERALDLEAERLEGEFERMIADPGYASFEHRHHAYVGRGQYVEQIDRMSAALGPDRLYVMDADDFFADPFAELSTLTKWLGISDWHPPAVEQWNARPSKALDPALRERLMDHFEPFDALLEQRMGTPPSWRR